MISQRFLEAHLFQLSTEGDWEIFMDVLALTLYGVVLFPCVGNYIDYATIDIFVAVRTRSENPVTAVLADTYLALNLCYETKIRKMFCCVHILCVWLMARVGDNILGVKCPIELVPEEIRKEEW